MPQERNRRYANRKAASVGRATRRNTYISRIGTSEADRKIDADVTFLETRVSQNEADIAYLEAPPPLIVSADITLDQIEWYVRATTSGITITLEATPLDGSRHYIRNASTGNITVDFNGEDYEGSSGVTEVLYPGEVLNFHYSTADGWWVNS